MNIVQKGIGKILLDNSRNVHLSLILKEKRGKKTWVITDHEILCNLIDASYNTVMFPYSIFWWWLVEYIIDYCLLVFDTSNEFSIL